MKEVSTDRWSVSKAKIAFDTFLFLFLAAFLFASCKKEMACAGCRTGNEPPIALAGPDQVIILPTDSTLLDGSASSDPGGKINAWQWTKIAGPASFSLADAKAAKTLVKNLTAGTYSFQLVVTNDDGRSSKDTVQLSVFPAAATVSCDNSSRPVVHVQLVPVGMLSQARQGIAVASAGDQILFAGGYILNGSNSSRVDIYDLTRQAWSTAELSEARYAIAAVANGNKILFGGGEIGDGSVPSRTVDIYDAETSQWKQTALSIAGNGIAAAAVGNKVLFAGGDAGVTLSWPANWQRTTRVDIYDLTTTSWSTASLHTVRRAGHAAVTANNKVYFSGGESWPSDPVPGTWFCSNTIDVYDNATNSWSTSFLTEGRLGHAGIAANDKVIWAGGLTGSFPAIAGTCSAEIHNLTTGEVSVQRLASPGYRTAVQKGNQIIFSAGTDTLDVYDLSTNQWSVGLLPVKLSGASLISVRQTVYVAGGTVNNHPSVQVWKLEF